MSEPREFTSDEVRDKVLQHVASMSEYWATVKLEPERDTVQQRLDGLAFSILAMLDGASVDVPAFVVSSCPHETDKDYCQDKGENWFPQFPDVEVCDIAGGLHELYHKVTNR